MRSTHEVYLSKSTGSGIYREVFRPDGDIRGSVLLFHGLGDHSGTHGKAVDIFCNAGLAVITIDWPGNGKSEGKRGHIPGLERTRGVINETIDFAKSELGEFGESPAVYAHSTGAYFVLYYLAILKSENPFSWIWLSSPLLNPAHGQTWVKRKLSSLIAEFVPTLTFPTGVRPEMCFHVPDRAAAIDSGKFEGCHARVSAQLGSDLIESRHHLPEGAAKISGNTPFLLTQGSADEICPPIYSKELFEEIASSHKCYELFEGLRHEPFREPENAVFLERVKEWICKRTPPVQQND